MRTKVIAYAVFFAVMTAVMFIWPFDEYGWGDVVAVCVATLAVNKSVRSLSFSVLFAVVFLETIAMPVGVLVWISHGTLASVLLGFVPDDWYHLRNLVNLVLPITVLGILVPLFRSSWWMGVTRQMS
ncbi:MAG TPA: hypothetical protein VKC56_05615 [Gallionellaceae bacterium]|nr:hypothetical protein [Gallionellaceae bacterium]